MSRSNPQYDKALIEKNLADLKRENLTKNSRRKVSFLDVVDEKMRREKKVKEPKLKTLTKKIQRLLLKPFDYDANLS